jgi:hypothetical protein
VRRAALIAVLALAVLPASALAKHIPFGSSLSATPNHIESEGVDSAYWNTNLPGTRKFRVPAKGKIGTIKLKGNKVGSNGPNVVHFQILHPIGGGRLRVELTSGNNKLQVGGDKNHVTTYHPINLCAREGDFVAFSVVGGNAKWQVFSKGIAGSAFKSFTGAGGDMNGDTFSGTKHSGEELLMRTVDFTGDDAGICRTKHWAAAASR